jgi:lysophospholipase L1-like esterase
MGVLEYRHEGIRLTVCEASLRVAGSALLVAAFALFPGACSQPPPPDDAIRIMPLGDSITQGTAEHGSYRRALWLRLRESGLEVDFIGSLDTYHGLRRGPRDFDTDHEGHWGWTTGQVADRLDGWIAGRAPDIALIQLGVNDMAHGRRVKEILSDLERIVTTLRERNPDVKVLLGKAMPIPGEGAWLIPGFNTALEQLAARLSSENSPVLTADHYAGFDAEAHTYDGIHPNAVGAERMAQNWFQALKAVLPALSE